MKDPIALRRSFPDAEDFGYRFGSNQVVASQVGVRSMNFGQEWRTEGIPEIEYTVKLPSSFFGSVLESFLPDFVSDAREHPDETCEFEGELRSNGWPSVLAILQTENLRRLALEWIAHDMLLKWFGDGEPNSSPGFVINTIEGLSFDHGEPLISGFARRTGDSNLFQDR